MQEEHLLLVLKVEVLRLSYSTRMMVIRQYCSLLLLLQLKISFLVSNIDISLLKRESKGACRCSFRGSSTI